jgi:CHASE3 domain sensor protein
MKLTKLKYPYLKVIFASGLLASMFILFYSNSNNNNVSTALVEHTEQVIKNNDDLLLSLVNHQTGIRGYLLTNETSLLEPYKASLPRIKLHLKELNRLTKDDPNQQNRVDSLKTLFEKRIDFSTEIILKNHANQLTNVQKSTITKNGEIITYKIKALLTAINDTEYKLLAERKGKNYRDKQNTNVLFIILLISSFILLIYTVLSVRKNAKRTIISQKEKDALEHKAH